MKKERTIIKTVVLAAAIVLVLTSCSNSVINLTMPDGTNVSIKTRGLTKDQIEILKEVEKGEENTVELLRSGLFTLEELYSLGLDLPGKFPNINFGDGISDGYPDKNAPGAGN